MKRHLFFSLYFLCSIFPMNFIKFLEFLLKNLFYILLTAVSQLEFEIKYHLKKSIMTFIISKFIYKNWFPNIILDHLYLMIDSFIWAYLYLIHSYFYLFLVLMRLGNLINLDCILNSMRVLAVSFLKQL